MCVPAARVIPALTVTLDLQHAALLSQAAQWHPALLTRHLIPRADGQWAALNPDCGAVMGRWLRMLRLSRGFVCALFDE